MMPSKHYNPLSAPLLLFAFPIDYPLTSPHQRAPEEASMPFEPLLRYAAQFTVPNGV